MTDEEMAEEYAREWLYHVKDLELHHKEDDKPEYIRIKQAFLAGLKAGRPQLHDLRKDPTDLPKDSKEVLIITSDNRKHIGFYDKDWYCSECGGIVIAWCELSTFNKE